MIKKSRERKIHDWASLKAKFMSCNLTFREFAKENDISESTFLAKASKEKWHEERQRHKNRIATESIDKSIKKRINKLSDYDNKAVDIANILAEKAREMSREIGSASELKSLTSAVKDAQAIIRLALGASTDNTMSGGVEDYASWLKDIEKRL